MSPWLAGLADVGRPQLYPADAILDGARAVVVEKGVRAATVGAIARASRAPTGSIYHRFGSVQEVLARMWIRAVRRSQEVSVLSVTETDPVEAVVAAALGTYDFCTRHPDDARLLSLFRREDFLAAGLPAELRSEVESINDAALEAAKEAARLIFGRRRCGVDLVLAAGVDLPYGLARPYLEAGRKPPPARRERIPHAARAILAHG
jgi:AcrR family transcriptional regulator